jgi:hypothetical protein
MLEWRDSIVRPFVHGLSRIIAVADPDGLFRESKLLEAIQGLGFGVHFFEDSITFRYDYENLYRSKWDDGIEMELVVVFEPGEHNFETLPADVLSQAHRLSFSLKDIFPRLSYNVVSQLDIYYFDALFQAQQQHASQSHDELQTRGFVLRHVFGIEPAVIKSTPDLLRMLCHRHYSRISVPPDIDAYLVRALKENPGFAEWPLDVLVPNRAAFWEFLNERWPIFVRHSKGGALLIKDAPPLKYAGPLVLPFGHDDVRVYIDNLFEDGLLSPIEWDWNDAVSEKWIRVGLLGNREENLDLRFVELLQDIEASTIGEDSKAIDWLSFAHRYAQASYLWAMLAPPSRANVSVRFDAFRNHIDERFFRWLSKHYSGLYNYPSSKPMMVHHIPGFVGHRFAERPQGRWAFVLVDGLALDQWLVVKEQLQASGMSASMEEDAVFAWIPTITPVSRQAAFSGKIPRYFAETIDRTNCDESGWRNFWSDRGFSKAQVGFASLTGDIAELASLDDYLNSPVKALGITLYKVDKIMHGMQLGAVGMAGQVRTWASEGFLLQLLRKIQLHGFDVVLSSDHGNTEAIGAGKPSEGILSDKRGERCRIYPDPALSKICRSTHPDAVSWEHPGLPEATNVVLAPYGQAFSQPGASIICHGGASLEEVCVPFVRIRWSER